MSRRAAVTVLVASLLTLAWGSATQVWAIGRHASDSCPQCKNKVCQPSPEMKKEKKTSYSVEYKDICLPGPRWPWQPCCEPNCGKVKTVKMLKKYEYECEKCGIKWTVVGGCEPCQK